MFKGTGTAIITPFTQKGVDYDGLAKLIEYQIDNNIDALFVCGTTGEASTMTEKEQANVHKFCIKQVANRVPVIVGTGCNCTATAVERTKRAAKLGADGVLVVTPYYNKCTQDGLVAHYSAISDCADIPVFAYNVPARTGVNILPQTAQKLTDIKNIVAIKEASGNLEQIKKTIELTQGSNIEVFSGDDGLAIDIIKLGGQGLISVASNVAPREMHEMTTLALSGKIKQAEAMSDKYQELFKELFSEVNPIPVKYACSLLGLCQNNLRLPLTPMTADNAQKLKNTMIEFGIIER